MLPDQVEILAIQLPGRENRLREACIHDMDEIVEALERQFDSCLDSPFVFFGHSLGALIAYELLHRLETCGRRRAELFFASAAPAPHTHLVPKAPIKLTHLQILADLRKISPAHTSLLDDPEIRALMLPMLQADFEVYANYRYRKTSPLHSPLVVIRGETDAYITHQSQVEWEIHTDHEFSFHTIRGPHLFMIESSQALLAILNSYLRPLLDRRRHDGPPFAQNAW